VPLAQDQFAETMPSDLQAILQELDRLDGDARDLVQDLSDAQVNWQPREGKTWSIGQCLDHLAKTNFTYTAAICSAVRAVDLKVARERPIQPGWFGRFFLRSVEPPPRWKISAPKKIVPASNVGRDEALKTFLDSHNGVRALVRECAKFDLNRIRFRNPFIPVIRFTVGTGLLVIPAHGRRHLWQAGRVRQLLAQ
jgi:DinB family protein